MNRQVAVLKIEPSMGLPKTEQIVLEETETGYQLSHTVTSWPEAEQTAVVFIHRDVAEEQISLLQQASIPAYPRCQEMVLDGTFCELKLYGLGSQLTINWWTVPPEGCQILGNFVEWLVHMAATTEMEE